MLVQEDLERLRTGNVKPTRGDIRCVAYGHLVRLAIWNLRKDWKIDRLVSEKLKTVTLAIEKLGGWSGVERQLSDDLAYVSRYQTSIAREKQEHYEGESDEISF